jgi:hypothetical protein
MKRSAVTAIGALGFGVAACVTLHEQLRTRAAFDLNCPTSDVAVIPLSGSNAPSPAGVTGCGKKATYVWAQETGWKLDTPIMQLESNQVVPGSKTQGP